MRLSRWACFVSVVVLLCTAGPACAVIINGGFEEFAVGAEFNTPLNWETFNYCAVDANFIPQPDFSEYMENWKIDVEAGLYPCEGDNHIILSTGDLEPEWEILRAELSQRIQISAGDKISGSYFFGTFDYLRGYNDFAEIKIVSVADPNLETSLLDVTLDVATIGNQSSTDGWQDFEYIFDESEVGSFDLTFCVEDSGDEIYNTYLLVDAISICHVPDYGDFNQDCEVDLTDFSMLSGGWMLECVDLDTISDPNDYPDPNDCILTMIFDADGSLQVDVNDVSLMSGCWLEGR